MNEVERKQTYLAELVASTESERAALSERSARLEAQEQRLQTDAKAQLNLVGSRLEDLRSQRQALDEERKEFSCRAKAEHERLASLGADSERRRRVLDRDEQACAELKQEITSERALLLKEREETAALAKQLQQRQLQQEQAEAAVHDLEQTLERTKRDLERVELRKRQAEDETERLERKQAEHVQAVERHTKQLRQQSEHLEMVKEELAHLQAEVADCERRKTEIETLREELRVDKQAFEERLSEIERREASFEEAERRLRTQEQQRLQALTKRMRSQLEVEFQERDVSRVKEVETEKQRLNRERSELRASARRQEQDIRKAIRALEQKKSELQDKARSLDAESAQRRQELSGREQACAEFESSLKRRQTDLDQQFDRINHELSTLASGQREVEHYLNALEAREQALDASGGSIPPLNTPSVSERQSIRINESRNWTATDWNSGNSPKATPLFGQRRPEKNLLHRDDAATFSLHSRHDREVNSPSAAFEHNRFISPSKDIRITDALHRFCSVTDISSDQGLSGVIQEIAHGSCLWRTSEQTIQNRLDRFKAALEPIKRFHDVLGQDQIPLLTAVSSELNSLEAEFASICEDNESLRSDATSSSRTDFTSANLLERALSQVTKQNAWEDRMQNQIALLSTLQEHHHSASLHSLRPAESPRKSRFASKPSSSHLDEHMFQDAKPEVSQLTDFESFRRRVRSNLKLQQPETWPAPAHYPLSLSPVAKEQHQTTFTTESEALFADKAHSRRRSLQTQIDDLQAKIKDIEVDLAPDTDPLKIQYHERLRLLQEQLANVDGRLSDLPPH